MSDGKSLFAIAKSLASAASATKRERAGKHPRSRSCISCVTNEARACHQCNTYRAPASATSATKRERACKQYGSRSCISYVGNEARACLQAVWVTLLHRLRQQRSESVPASSMGHAPASARSATKRERACKQYGSRSCISYVGNEARACPSPPMSTAVDA